MLSELEQDRIVVVLVRARNPQNIGAAARAMHDFGLRRLRVVNEYEVPFEGARSAVDASSVLASATSHATLAEAVADCTLILGTTAVGERELRHPLLTLPEAAPTIRFELARSPQTRVALLFGSEKTGLSNDELSFCHSLLTIPMHQHPDVRHPSMNLGQAVAVCLYELVRTPPPPSPAHAATASPSSAELERLTALLADVLEATEYTRRHPAHIAPSDLRRLIRRMALDNPSTTIWMGIFRQILWKLRRDSPTPTPKAE
jgi:TrmH family RNA methyltransferase